MTRLWEIDHPYYASEGDYQVRDRHAVYSSWQDFTVSIFHSGDPNLNFLYRWDWDKPGYHGWEGPEVLRLYFVLQRKGICSSVQMPVAEADEPAVRAWLVERARTVVDVWAPIALHGAADAESGPR
ncbi:hypothetical protein ACIQGZ_17380 [Streptomyces sp. NPDC092296]|uniref:hypothetical protein n=1 Tax=Streptomyces sp. NPDC092296 TaxID=3366012 RepID=UPI0037F33C45